MTPACMTADELALWRDANRRLTGRLRDGRPCADCPLAFALEMRADGCCNGTPGPATGRPRISEAVVAYRGRGSKYPTEAERIAARRQQWRDYDARKVARAREELYNGATEYSGPSRIMLNVPELGCTPSSGTLAIRSTDG